MKTNKRKYIIYIISGKVDAFQQLVNFAFPKIFFLMTKLSVNINKIATLRNSRGGNNPDVLKAALDIERFGSDGITVHPRPDERHIRYSDVYALKKHI
ncbi:MAG: hypothetical protein RLY16_2671, partial [Bacteroidota bacterium]